MFKVSLMGSTFRITFRHSDDLKQTECFIFGEHQNGGEKPELTPITSATVQLYYKDHSNREKANKYALAKALKGLAIPKAHRQIFWDGYLKMRGGWGQHPGKNANGGKDVG